MHWELAVDMDICRQPPTPERTELTGTGHLLPWQWPRETTARNPPIRSRSDLKEIPQIHGKQAEPSQKRQLN